MGFATEIPYCFFYSSVQVCLCLCARVCLRESVCRIESERENVCVYVRVCVRLCARVCLRESLCERERKRERECVCVRACLHACMHAP